MAKARLVHRPIDGQEPTLDDVIGFDLGDWATEEDEDQVPTREGHSTRRSNTVATKKVKEAPKEEVKEEKKEAKPENNNVKLADVAKEFGLTGRALRIYLRSKNYTRSEGRWEWDPKSADLARLRKELTAKAEEAKKSDTKEEAKASKK